MNNARMTVEAISDKLDAKSKTPRVAIVKPMCESEYAEHMMEDAKGLNKAFKKHIMVGENKRSATENREDQVLSILKRARKPITRDEMAKRLSVSGQVLHYTLKRMVEADSPKIQATREGRGHFYYSLVGRKK